MWGKKNEKNFWDMEIIGNRRKIQMLVEKWYWGRYYTWLPLFMVKEFVHLWDCPTWILGCRLIGRVSFVSFQLKSMPLNSNIFFLLRSDLYTIYLQQKMVKKKLSYDYFLVNMIVKTKIRTNLWFPPIHLFVNVISALSSLWSQSSFFSWFLLLLHLLLQWHL